MAVSQITIDINELEGQRLGYNGVSLNNWTDTLVDAYDAGSKFECGGAIYQVTADEVMGTVGEWGGIANNTLVYSYFDPSAIDFHFTSTAPTWSGSKQGYYGTGGSATYRYLASIYKDGAGAYTQKTILLSREHGITATGLNLGGHAANADHVIRFATDASIMWDESDDCLKHDKQFLLNSFVTAADLMLVDSGSGTYKEFYLLKPISGYLTLTTLNSYLYIWQNSSYREINSSGLSNVYNLFLTPGKYKIQGGTGPSTSTKLYCTGVYGDPLNSVSNIITLI